jgi:hypothetical protein
MNTLYVLKGGMKFKFLALTVVVLLGLGVGNTAWGQCTAIASGNWSTASNWSCGRIPYDYEPATIPSGFSMTVTGDISQPDVTVAGTLTVSGTLTIPYGAFGLQNNAVLNVGSLSSIAPATIGDGAVIVSGGTIDLNSTNTIGQNVTMTATGNLEFDGTTTFGANSVVNAGGDLVMGDGDKLNLDANVRITINGNASAFKGGTIAAGAELRVKGNMAHSDGAFDIYGTVIVDEDFSCTSSGGFHVYSGGKLIVKGNSVFSSMGGVNIEGDLLLNGDLDYSNSSTFTLSAPGLAAVGGDLTIGTTNINIGANTNLIVLGDLTFNSGGSTIDGSVVVIGEVDVSTSTGGDIFNCTGCELADSGCQPACKLEAEIPSEHPIWDVFVGLNTVYFNDVPRTITGPLTSSVEWTYGPISANCKNRIKVSYFMTISGTGDAVLQYSENGVDWSTGDPVQKNPAIDRYFWEGTDGNGVPIGTGTIFLRILVRSLDAGSTVTFDKILVDAFNEGGEGSKAIVWVATPDVDVCKNQLAVYEIANISDYTDIRWNYPDEGYVEIVSISPNKARCEVKWKNSPGVLKVTAFGGSCGGESASVTYTINVNQPTSFSAFYEKTDISCPTAPNNGSITLRSCGGTGTVSYQWETGPVGYTFANPTAPTISNLPEGIYSATVYLDRGLGTEESQPLTIEIKRPVLVDITFDPSTLNAFLCPTDLTAGHFEIIATGGTPPYDITVTKDGSDITNSDNSLVYSNLRIGAYVVSVDDKNNCGVRTFPLSIVEDTEAPTFTNFPANVQMTMAEYQANTGSKLTTTTSNLTGGTLSAPSALTITPILPPLSGLHNLKLSFTVSQSPESANDADEFYVEMTTDGTTWVPILTDINSLDNLNVTIPLGENADGNTNLGIRFRANIATSSLTYTVSNVQISGSRFAVISPTCNDNSSVCSVSYIDNKPQWSSCSGYSNAGAEFYIERTWTAVDACGLPVERTQYLSVGTAPKFTAGSFPENETLDFCNNTPTIKSPTASDGCGAVTVSWEVRNSANEVVGYGVVTTLGDNVTLPVLPADAAGDTDLEYTVTWTATDDSHMTLSQDQKITIKPVIVAEYTYNVIPDGDGKLNVCLKQPVQITIAPKGGTGVYTYSDFSPAVTGTAPVVTTTGLTTTTPDLSFKITDVDNGVGVTGGCTVDLKSASFDVHDLIPTGGIIRE